MFSASCIATRYPFSLFRSQVPHLKRNHLENERKESLLIQVHKQLFRNIGEIMMMTIMFIMLRNGGYKIHTLNLAIQEMGALRFLEIPQTRVFLNTFWESS